MPFRIGILGIGGVGGYLGGKLAGRYAGSDNVETIFIARGANELALRTHGLRLITPEGEKSVRPAVISSSPAEIGRLDLLVVCTKSYDLEDGIGALRGSIAPETIILSFLNGVGLAERIRKVYPGNPAWEGCVYIIAELRAPGVVNITSKRPRYLFGSEPADQERLGIAAKYLTDAGIDARVPDDIRKAMWEKYFLISPLATLTSFLDTTGDLVIADAQHKATMMELMNELWSVSEAKGVGVSRDVVDRTLSTIASFPPGSMTSMHRDFRNGKRTELDALTGYVVEAATLLGVKTPRYGQLWEALKARTPG